MTYLISLINDHVFPVYLFIKEMERRQIQYDRLLFVVSRRKIAKERTQRIEQTLHITEGADLLIEVPVNDLKAVLTNLECAPAIRFSHDDTFIVNLSCDATIMSIGAYHFFSRYEKSEFYYLPPGENIVKNIRTTKSEPLLYRVNVWEYFTLHGLRV